MKKKPISSVASADETDDGISVRYGYHLCNRRREIYLQKQWQRQDLYMHWDWRTLPISQMDKNGKADYDAETSLIASDAGEYL